MTSCDSGGRVFIDLANNGTLETVKVMDCWLKGWKRVELTHYTYRCTRPSMTTPSSSLLNPPAAALSNCCKSHGRFLKYLPSVTLFRVFEFTIWLKDEISFNFSLTKKYSTSYPRIMFRKEYIAPTCPSVLSKTMLRKDGWKWYSESG